MAAKITMEDISRALEKDDMNIMHKDMFEKAFNQMAETDTQNAERGKYPDDSACYAFVASELTDMILDELLEGEYETYKKLTGYVKGRKEQKYTDYIGKMIRSAAGGTITMKLMMNMLFTDIAGSVPECLPLAKDLMKRFFRTEYRVVSKFPKLTQEALSQERFPNVNSYCIYDDDKEEDEQQVAEHLAEKAFGSALSYVIGKICGIPMDPKAAFILRFIGEIYDYYYQFDDEDDDEETEEEKNVTECMLGIFASKVTNAEEKKDAAKKEAVPTEIPAEANQKEEKDEEIKRLKAKLAEVEYQVGQQRNLYETQRTENRKLIETIAVCQREHNELVELKRTLAAAREPSDKEEEASVEEMSNAIEKKRIVIIGGHDNWTYKLKNRFRKWTYLTPEAQGSMPASVVNEADIIYFFSDHICHPQYNRFLDVARQRGIRVSYINRVNIAENIRQIYKETCTV